MSELSPQEINRLLREFAKEVLDDYEDMKTYREKPATIDEIEGNAFGMSVIRDETQEQLALSDYRKAYRLVDQLLEDKGVTLDKEADSYRKLCREMLKVQLDLHDELSRREWGDYSGGDTLKGMATQSAIWSSTEEVKEQGKLLSEVIQHHIEENRAEGIWTPKSESAIIPIIELFKNIVGDLPIRTIDRQMISEYQSKLKKLPPNREKDTRYRDKSVAELLKLNPPPEKTISEGTIRNHIARVVALFNHAENHGFIDNNPAKGLKKGRKTKKEKEKRGPFDHKELDALFGSQEYIEDTMAKGFMFWLPILALFTGARIAELSQLHLEDIKQTEGGGVWYLDINDEGPTKRLKNMSSNRKVPLHPFIAEELNLPGYVARLRSEGADRLFPDLSYSLQEGFARRASRWFNQNYKVKCGVVPDPDGPLKDFHSFRTTFSTHLGQKRGTVDDRMLEQVLGHSSGKSTTFNTYVDDFNPDQLYEGVVVHIDYGIDFSHLTRSKYVAG